VISRESSESKHARRVSAAVHTRISPSRGMHAMCVSCCANSSVSPADHHLDAASAWQSKRVPPQQIRAGAGKPLAHRHLGLAGGRPSEIQEPTHRPLSSSGDGPTSGKRVHDPPGHESAGESGHCAQQGRSILVAPLFDLAVSSHGSTVCRPHRPQIDVSMLRGSWCERRHPAADAQDIARAQPVPASAPGSSTRRHAAVRRSNGR
jgi:hypothetical protein